ncbi:hypothetical protein Csa_002250 [Cucumis sativus]|uniref:Uncharacterized protein n=1 Tax=Cucumis sativus TaxID=3659 RepID=A0A0A0LBT9_CUCSA|nr:hypothetical protein Csa_002250 [Cucumis sativus]
MKYTFGCLSPATIQSPAVTFRYPRSASATSSSLISINKLHSHFFQLAPSLLFVAPPVSSSLSLSLISLAFLSFLLGEPLSVFHFLKYCRVDLVGFLFSWKTCVPRSDVF